MLTLSERIKMARLEAGSSKSELAKAVGVSPSAITQWENGNTKALKSANLIAAARFLGVNYEWLATGRGDRKESNVVPGPDIRREAPLISWVAAGQFNESSDPYRVGEAEASYPMPRRAGPNTYCLRVQGDSMTAPHGKTYPAGCIIFVDPDLRAPASGARIIARLEGSSEVTFKVFVLEAGRTFLRPLNPQYPPIYDEFRVIGTVIGKWEDE